ncbi:helix-hairpin-helix domain-containing protein [Halomonas sp. M5N1S17]|uniref:helix-hairpin-helix domain-containing protein n=1 Tax=Halomonas alkalisoli TaxID=2907158 RepID=UPI001F2CF423|nr:helix-hairpin-helix domain-containing protein [Halomonas alkalisoli]MCE9662966.1 helix-hairpin-helix domain-containing protein [Halomonas alkalisoli]
MVIRLFVAWLVMMPSLTFADIIVGSWNIKNLGWDNDKRYDKVAHVASHFDLLAIQELMNEEALERLEQEVEAMTGESWSSMASHALGRSTYREQYAFLWRDSAVEYHSGAVVFFDHRDMFAREPYSAKFRSRQTGQEFAAATVHITYGRRLVDRLPEIEALADYWQWLEEVYPDTPRLLLGDFNLRPEHLGWEPLRALGVIPVITDGATTLGLTDGRYANLYDNIWKIGSRLDVTERGIVRFPELFGIDHERARDAVSDHAPVYLTLGSARLELRAFNGNVHIPGEFEESCIDINAADPEQLNQLPHVGPARATNIDEGRPWQSLEDLTRIQGLSAARIDEIQKSGLLCE